MLIRSAWVIFDTVPDVRDRYLTNEPLPVSAGGKGGKQFAHSARIRTLCWSSTRLSVLLHVSRTWGMGRQNDRPDMHYFPSLAYDHYNAFLW